MLFIILPLLFITLMLIFALLLGLFVKDGVNIKRIGKYIDKDEISREKTKPEKKDKDLRYGLSILSAGVKKAKFLDGYKEKIKDKLTMAHVLLKPEEFITICFIVVFLLGSMVYLLTFNMLFAVLAGIIGWFIPTVIINSKRKKRLKTINDQLGDVIVMISNSLKAGYSFFQTVDLVSREMSGPAAEEFTILKKEVTLGVTTEKALEGMVDRVKSEDLEMMVTAILIQRQTGGNLAEILDNISTTIRERVKLKKEVKTLTATGRMSGIVISLLPIGLFLVINLINPDYMKALYSSPLGYGIIAYAVVSELIGIVLVNKICKVEV